MTEMTINHRGSVSDLNLSRPSRGRSPYHIANLWLLFLHRLGLAFHRLLAFHRFGLAFRRRRYSDVVGYFFGAAALSRLSSASFGAGVFGFASQGRLTAGYRRGGAREDL